MIKWSHITSTFHSRVHRFKWRMARVDLEMWDKINHRWLEIILLLFPSYHNSSEEPILWDNLLFPLNLIPLHYKYNIKISCRTMASKTLEYEGSIFLSIVLMQKYPTSGPHWNTYFLAAGIKLCTPNAVRIFSEQVPSTWSGTHVWYYLGKQKQWVNGLSSASHWKEVWLHKLFLRSIFLSERSS